MPTYKPLIIINDIKHKECCDCLIIKSIDNFCKKKVNKDGLYSYCKQCKKEHDLLYKQNNKEKCKKISSEYYLNNKKEIREKQKNYHFKNKEKHNSNSKNYYLTHKLERNEYEKNRKKENTLYKLKCYFRSRTSLIINKKNWNKTSNFIKYIGCDLETLKNHIENQFQLGMSWNNYGKYTWHIDHIIPLASASTEEELYKLCHYTNLQPLWAVDNLIKGSKINE